MRRYANGGDHEDWNIKSGSSRNRTTTTKPAPTKRWTAPTPQTAAFCSPPTSSFLPSKTTPTNHTRVASSEESRPTPVVSVPSKISVAATAKMFESASAPTGSVSPAPATTSIAKARAAFFNSLAAGSTAVPYALPSNNPPRSFNVAKAAFTVPAAKPASRSTPGGASLAAILKSVASTSDASVVEASTSVSTATYTATTKLSLASRPPTSPASVPGGSLVPLKEEEEEISPKNALKRKVRK